MTDQKFVSLLGGWIPPSAIAMVAKEAGTKEADEIVQLRYMGQRLRSAEEIGMDLLFDLYLSHFFVPEEVVEVARSFCPEVTEEIAAEIGAIRFSGTRSFDPGDAGQFGTLLAEIEAPLRVARLIQVPLAMLTRLFDNLAVYWEKVLASQPASNVHHEHRFEWALPIMLDVIVARHLGIPQIGHVEVVPRSSFSVGLRGRGWTVVSRDVPIVRRLIENVRTGILLGLYSEELFIDMDLS